MRDIADMKESFEQDELVHDFEFSKRLYDCELAAYRFNNDEELIWGDLA